MPEEKLHVGARVPDLDRGGEPGDGKHVEAVDEEPQAEAEPWTALRPVVILREQLQRSIPTENSTAGRGEE